METDAEGPTTLVICCGALAREIVGIVRDNGWDHIRIECLPAKLHNSPEVLPEGVRVKIKAGREKFDHIIVGRTPRSNPAANGVYPPSSFRRLNMNPQIPPQGILAPGKLFWLGN